MIQHKLVSHQYFIDDMTWTELVIIIKGIAYAEVEEWNRTRHLMLSIISPYMKQKMKPYEFMPLIIDEEYKDRQELTTEVDDKSLEWFKKFKENYKKEG